MLRVVHDSDEHTDAARDADATQAAWVGLDELCRLAAGEMLAVALEAERRAYLPRTRTSATSTAGRMVVGNGYAR